MALTRSEQFVFDLCNITFLKLWSHDNPIGKKSKELCDVLIVCGNDILIFSVKEININPSGDNEVDEKRWLKRAVDDSVKQVYGAERILSLKDHFTLKDNKTQIALPPKNQRCIHRICVSIGRGAERSLPSGDFGNGFVHVFDEVSVDVVLSEMDTIIDFITYLKAKEALIDLGKEIILSSETDLLAHYIMGGNSFHSHNIKADVLLYENGIWEGLQDDASYIELKEQNEISYAWDELIDIFIQHHLDDTLIIPISRSTFDTGIFMMAKETRENRRVLSNLFRQFMNILDHPRPKTRTIQSPTNKNVIYLWLLGKSDPENRHERIAELELKCRIARYRVGSGDIVIGIATDPIESESSSFDICSLNTSNWSVNDDAFAKSIIEQFDICIVTKDGK